MPNANRADEEADAPSGVPCLQKVDSPTGSPPKPASLSDMMELENCVSNLSLAHEIVVNTDFRFREKTPPKDSLEGQVTEVVHRAFWDVVRQQLSSTPPDYTHAVTLLQEVRTTLLSLLLPAHGRLKAQVEEVLDAGLIQQQAERGALDLPALGGYLVRTMGALCAPVRDPEIRALHALSDPVDLLREMFRVLGLMKVDMANYTVQTLRPSLLQQAVQYERAKFQQILDRQPDSLVNTSAWLGLAAQTETTPNGHPEEGSRSGPWRGPVSPAAVLTRAYLRLLSWDTLSDQTYPETVLMDRARLDFLGQRLRLLVLEASVLLLTSTQCGGAVFSLHGFVGKLKLTIAALLEGSHSRAFDLQGALQGLGDQVLAQVTEALANHGAAPLPQESQELLKGQITDLARDNNPIRLLIGERVQAYLGSMVDAGGSSRSPLAPPPGLGLLRAELEELGTSFSRTVHFNRSVFGPFYAPILRGLLLIPSGEAEMGEGAR